MSNYISLDFETKIGHNKISDKSGKTRRVESLHGPTFRDPNNDIHTIIYGSHPNRIKLLHSKKGFKRKLPRRIGRVLLKSHTLITQNGKFDLCYIWQDKYVQQWLKKGGKLWDIGYCRYLLSYQRHAFPSLAEMQKIYLHVKTKKDRISYLFSKFIGADEIIAARDRCPRIWKLYCEYGIEDGRTPMLIMQKQYKQAKALGMLPIIELFNEYLLSLCMIEQNGIDVDLKQLEINEKIIHLEELEYLEKAESLVQEYWNDERLPKLNINSNDHKSLLLFGGSITNKVKKVPVGTGEIIKTGPNKGEEKTKLTVVPVIIKGFQLNPVLSIESAKQGFYATGEPIIEKIYKNSKNDQAKEFCKYMRLAATSRRMLNTYIKAFKDRSVNGKLYINLNNTETITSRLSSSKPNMQNIPVKDKHYNKLIQGLFIAPPGWTCVSIDFSQLEVYLQAMLSGDKKLIDDLKKGIDFHIKRMCWMPEVQALGVDYKQGVELCKVKHIAEWEQRRTDAKPIGFGKAYGKGEESMSRDTGIPLEDMKEIYKKENAEYWEVVDFEEQVSKEVYDNTQISRKSDYADKYTRGLKEDGLARRFLGDAELLPIKQSKGSSQYYFDREHIRHIGIYVSPTGKRYAFEERATKTVRDDIYKYFLSTKIKNYPMQGGASDVQAATTVEMFQFLLNNPDKVKMLNEIHDSKWFIVKDEYLSCIVPKLCAIMGSVKDIFKRRFNIDTELAFPAEAKIGKNFAEMETYKC